MPTTKFQRGFTLLEIMVVVAIIATILTLAVISIGDGGRGAKVYDAARRLQLVSEVGSQHAVFVGRPVGVSIGDNFYEFQIYEKGEWKSLNGSRSLRNYEFGSGIRLTELTDQTISSDAQPSMLFLPDGENLLTHIVVDDEYSEQVFELIPIAGVYDLVQSGVGDE